MDIRTYQGSQKYLKAGDLLGRPVIVTIRDTVEETVGQGKDSEEKPVLWFVGKEKALVLNTTNGSVIAEQFGFETQAWSGKQIELYPTTTEFGGKTVDCIRIRVPAPVVAPVAAPVAADGGGAVPTGEVPF